MQPSIANFMRLSFGNIIEWYDFSLYVYFAVFVAKDFFPSHDPFVSMLLAFSAFFWGLSFALSVALLSAGSVIATTLK